MATTGAKAIMAARERERIEGALSAISERLGLAMPPKARKSGDPDMTRIFANRRLADAAEAAQGALEARLGGEEGK